MSGKSRNNQSDVANVSWLEWKDSDLNNEKWGVPKDGPDGLFLDTEYVAMPRSLKPDRWIRAKDLQRLTVLSFTLDITHAIIKLIHTL